MPVAPPHHLTRYIALSALLLAGGACIASPADIPKQMQAARVDSAAAPGSLKIETVDVPSPQDGQVLIKVYAAAINPSDWNIRRPGGPGPGGPPGAGGPPPAGGAGAPPPMPPGMRMGPRNPGNDVAGIVVALGAGVTEFKLGQPVIAALQEAGGGALAQYAVGIAANMAPKPKRFTYEQAAGIPTAGFTGLRMVILANLMKGERVLVIGAAGGVGSTAVQAAKARGAHVIALASSQHNAYLKSIGAAEIVNYDKQNPADLIKDVDVVINTVGSENAAALGYARKGGRVVLIAGQPDAVACMQAAVECISGGPGQGPSVGALMSDLVQMADRHQYTVDVEKSFPLAQANDAYAYGRTGNREGKVIVDVDAQATKR